MSNPQSKDCFCATENWPWPHARQGSSSQTPQNDQFFIDQSLEFVAETRTLAEMKMESRRKIYCPWETNLQAYFFSMKIKICECKLKVQI